MLYLYYRAQILSGWEGEGSANEEASVRIRPKAAGREWCFQSLVGREGREGKGEERAEQYTLVYGRILRTDCIESPSRNLADAPMEALQRERGGERAIHGGVGGNSMELLPLFSS